MANPFNTSSVMDHMAALVNDATGALEGVKSEIESLTKLTAERFLNDMDVARRTETDDIISRLERLEKRLDSLEGSLKSKG
jgi:BMFP domain-containing protein YqiC